MKIQSSFFKSAAWLISPLIFLIAILSTGCGGDQGRSPILGLPAAEIVSLSISPLNSSIQISALQQYVATASYADGSSRVVTGEGTWSSGSTAYASVNSGGLAQGMAAGSTSITVRFADRSASANLTVLPVTLVSIAVTPATPTIPVGNLQSFKAIGSFSNGTSADITAIVIFSVADTAIARVSSIATVTGINVGVTSVTASSGSLSASTSLTVSPAALVSLAITPINPSLSVGASRTLTVIANYTDGSTVNVSANSKYVSLQPGIVTVVTDSGLVTGISTGNSVVSANFNGMTVSTTVTVPPVAVVSIELTPVNPNIYVAGIQSFTAMATYDDASISNISHSVIWTSSDITKATILPGGTSTGLAVGSSTITATFQSKSASTILNVLAVPTMIGINVTPPTNTMLVGSTKNLVATALYSDTTTANISTLVSWSSSQLSISTVSPFGVVTGIGPGTATINASLNGFTGSASMTVTPVLAMTAITVTPINSSSLVGSTSQFVATAVYDDFSTQNISNSALWSSSNPLIATISNSAPKGLASALSVGSSLITASQGLFSGSTNFNVTATQVIGINLRTAASFGVLAGNSITNNSGGLTLVTGDVGSPSQTVDPVQTAGYVNYKSGAVLDGALADLQVAITDANTRSCDVNSASGINLGGLILPPGVYCYAGAITITGTFTMNGPGLYIFRTNSTLNTSSNSIVALTGGALAANAFWVPTAPTTLGANSAFIGTIMSNSAAITMGDMATLQNGRVLSGSAVTLKNNVITR